MAIDWSVISESNFYKDASPEEKEKAERNYFTANFGKDLEGEEYEKSFQEWKNSTSAPKEDAPKSEQTNTDKFIKSAINTMAGPLGLILEGADYVTDGEASKVFNTAGANTVNIVPELANLGIEAISGKKDVVPTVKVASPDTEVGKVAAEVLPYLIPVGGTAKGASAVGNTVAGAIKGAIPRVTSKAGTKAKDIAVGTGERFGRNVQQSVLGAAAGNDLSTTEGVGEAVEDTLLGGLIGAGTEKAVEGALKVGSKIIKPGNERRIENAKNILEEESDNAAKIKKTEESIEEDKVIGEKITPSKSKFVDEYEPVYSDNDSLDFLGGSVSDAPKIITGYARKGNNNATFSKEQFENLKNSLPKDATVDDAKKFLIEGSSKKAELQRLVADSPAVPLRSLADSGSSWLPIDTTKLPSKIRSSLAEGSKGAQVSNAVSNIGKLGDAGILSKVRPAILKGHSDKAVDSAVDALSDIKVSMGDLDSNKSIDKLIDGLKSGKSSDISVNDVATLNKEFNDFVEKRARAVADKVANDDDKYEAYLKALNSYPSTPSDIYNKAKGQAVLSESFATKNAPIEDSGNLIASIIAGGLTGGASSAVQAGLAGSKYLADRAIVNDVKRAAGVAVKGDNARNAISNTLDSAAEVAQTPASLIARPSVINVDDSIIEVDDSEFEQLIGAPESNSKGIIEVDDTEFESLINTPTDGVIEVDEDEFYRMSNPGEAYVGDRLYNGFKAAETGGVKNPWIRTMAQDKSSNLHSSAYGPAQVTYSLAQDYLNRKPNLFTDSEKQYLGRFVAQGKDMIAYSQGRHNDKRFAYGAEGILNSDEDKKMYERVVKKMLVDTYRNNGNSIVKTANAWRGLEDPAYNRKVIKNV